MQSRHQQRGTRHERQLKEPSRCRRALDAMREQAGAPMVPKAEPEAYIPTQEEKARADRSSAVPFGH